MSKQIGLISVEVQEDCMECPLTRTNYTYDESIECVVINKKVDDIDNHWPPFRRHKECPIIPLLPDGGLELVVAMLEQRIKHITLLPDKYTNPAVSAQHTQETLNALKGLQKSENSDTL